MTRLNERERNLFQVFLNYPDNDFSPAELSRLSNIPINIMYELLRNLKNRGYVYSPRWGRYKYRIPAERPGESQIRPSCQLKPKLGDKEGAICEGEAVKPSDSAILTKDTQICQFGEGGSSMTTPINAGPDPQKEITFSIKDLEIRLQILTDLLNNAHATTISRVTGLNYRKVLRVLEEMEEEQIISHARGTKSPKMYVPGLYYEPYLKFIYKTSQRNLVSNLLEPKAGDEPGTRGTCLTMNTQRIAYAFKIRSGPNKDLPEPNKTWAWGKSKGHVSSSYTIEAIGWDYPITAVINNYKGGGKDLVIMLPARRYDILDMPSQEALEQICVNVAYALMDDWGMTLSLPRKHWEAEYGMDLPDDIANLLMSMGLNKPYTFKDKNGEEVWVKVDKSKRQGKTNPEFEANCPDYMRKFIFGPLIVEGLANDIREINEDVQGLRQDLQDQKEEILAEVKTDIQESVGTIGAEVKSMVQESMGEVKAEIKAQIRETLGELFTPDPEDPRKKRDLPYWG